MVVTKRKGAPADIDPARIDLSDEPKRKRKPRLRDRHPMPAHVADAVEVAAGRKMKRPPTPGLMLEPDGEGSYTWTSPWQDDEAWVTLLSDAFGTRSLAVVKTFVGHLQGLVSESWDEDLERWKPSETEWNAALAIVNAARPENELQAMAAAQMVAIHWMQMRMASYSLSRSAKWIDPKDAATTSMLARTFMQQLDGLRKLQAKPKEPTQQTITVRKETHVHHHQHIHMEGGVSDFRGQPHTSGETVDVQKSIGRAESAQGCAALPSPDAGGEVVPLRRNGGKAGVPDARGAKSRRANGRG